MAGMADWGRMAGAAKMRRASLGLTQEEVVDRMPEHSRIGIETLRRVEAGDQETYRPTTLAVVSRALGWPAERLWAEAHGEAPPSIYGRVDELADRLNRVEEKVDQLLDRAERPGA